MASLNKLAIRGIRSFDDKSVSVIEFFSPVTVIVGHNGSGKTTIIECLKYATTGDQPPNTRGGAFIHDPKMANEKEVKAQVKLRFHAANGTRMLAVRNLSVTMKKTGGMTMKTLEGILGLAEGSDKSGKRGVISTKCAEMDTEIPQLLGVSKAVLENVIFCHQEDSYWPLAEPAALKKKFDDIFEATKYTKALDAIRSLRKDKVAELKAEKEKLESLSREKSHADKLRTRISDMTAEIVAKSIEHDEVKEQHRLKAEANKRFYDSSTKFREIYVQVDSLNKTKMHYQDELDALRETLQELSGTSEELDTRFRNFSDHILKQKDKKRSQEATIQDLEDDLEQLRVTHREKVSEHGQLTAEAKAHEAKIGEREKLIRDLSIKYNMQSYAHTPLEREKVIEFISRLSELQTRQNAETDRVTNESRRENEEYNAQYRKLHSEREGRKSRKRDLQERSATLRTSIAKTQREVDNAESLTSECKAVEADIEDKQRRIERIQDDLKTARFDERINEKNVKLRELEIRRSALFDEIELLSGQAEARAKLELKREDLRAKETELKNALSANNPRFRKHLGADANADTIERELDQAIDQKDQQVSELDSTLKNAAKDVQTVETMLSGLKAQLKEKSEEVKRLDEKIKVGMASLSQALESQSPHEAVKEAEAQVNSVQYDLDSASGASGVLTDFMARGREHKCCPLCKRDMNVQEFAVFEEAVNEKLEASTPAKVAENEEDLKEWQRVLGSVQGVAQNATARDKLNKEDIPSLKSQIKEQEAKLHNVSQTAEEAGERLITARRTHSDMVALKLPATTISRTQQDITRLKREIASSETDLVTSGSTKTREDVQVEIDGIKNDITSINREVTSMTADRERQNIALRAHEKDLHALDIKLATLKRDLDAKASKDAQIEEMKQEVTTASGTLKDLDVKISEADTAIDTLEQKHQITERDLNAQIAQAQRSSQELNVNVDKLSADNRTIEKYVKAKRARALQECTAKIEELDAEIAQGAQKVDSARKVLSGIEKEINESNATVANLRDNIRARKLVKDIADTQAEIDEYDLEEAAKAKRLFEEKYQIEKDNETKLQSKLAHIGGEIASMKEQLRVLEKDLKEFKDVNRRYRDQLIKVKLSDMANADLEKYAKALDSAIMKYHSLKMEEVNDTMRHLWNKTYQGTDIDGIKICSDDDKGTTGTRRSYNYRVVMTKDQVEMDMRGRCSAGQKMLASIIIRLALADSFGQNCGILALDEPTNALDTENIDALASSLVDIINERKDHASFQLIIITHDENFLRKLGQSNVMEYYWRVSRDSRQKSIIERHRFG